MGREYEITADDLAALLPSYRRWISEGKPPHGYSAPGQPKHQYYYDQYHDSIREDEDGTFSFSIQTFDSPEGDTWVRGKFKVDPGGQITITEQSAYAN